jgi:VanZ family protein
MRSLPVSLFHQWLWAVYLLALITASLLPVHLPQTVDHGDKVMHILAYALLVLTWPGDWISSRAVRFGLAGGLGLVLEIGQGVLPTGRFMDCWDALANALGAGLGLAGRQVLACIVLDRTPGRQP